MGSLRLRSAPRGGCRGSPHPLVISSLFVQGYTNKFWTFGLSLTKANIGKVFLPDPGKARGCSTNTSLTQSLSDPLVPRALWHRHAQTFRDTPSSYQIDYVIVLKNFLNPKGHQNQINGSKVTAILLKGWILPLGGASTVEGLRATGLPRLVELETA